MASKVVRQEHAPAGVLIFHASRYMIVDMTLRALHTRTRGRQAVANDTLFNRTARPEVAVAQGVER
jgi:hypothetical protein